MNSHAEEGVGTVMVVGGGVGGMRAAIDLAEAGIRVYLVETTPGLGGIVAQLGFMFPTHDCVLCRGTSDHGYGCTRPAISPAFMDHNQHPNVVIMTSTEVTDVRGEAGAFTVSLLHNPRYVDVTRCTSCGDCAQICPVVLPSRFQMGLATRKAIYKSAPRAIPNAYVIDKGDYCHDCRRCVEICSTGAINLDEQAWSEEVKVGAIILSVGYKLYDPRQSEEYGFGRYPNVVTSMQFERLASRSGPTEGIPIRPSDGKPPRKIAWLQCIGSRDQEHPYCSSICCMYATKEALLAKQRVPGVKCQIFMMDERAFNKEYNAYYEQARDLFAVKYTRCRVSALKEDPKTHDLLIRYLSEAGELREERFDLVVLSVGSEPPPKAVVLARKLGIDLNEYGFCNTNKFAPLETSRLGIYVCGAFSSPKEIAETLIEASGSAGEAVRLLSPRVGRLQASREYPFISRGGYPPERDVRGEPPRVGVFVCRCGDKRTRGSWFQLAMNSSERDRLSGASIGGVVDVSQVCHFAQGLPGVVLAEEMAYACLPEGQARLKEAIEAFHLNRVVVAACSHRTHESLFQRLIREVGLNPYLLEMANIREHCAWVHADQPQAATRKAQELVRMAVARAHTLTPVYKTALAPKGRALILGGGVSGMTAAMAIADSGFDVYLVEKGKRLGGNLHHIHYTAEGDDPGLFTRSLISWVENHPRITVLMETELVRHEGHVGNFRSTLVTRRDGSEPVQTVIEHGVTIVATGGNEYRGTEYLLGQDPRVITQLDLEEWINRDPEEVARLKSVVMIQCVRPYGEKADYCSRTCCTNTMKNALMLKALNPACQVIVLYKDIITYGFREQYYTEARRQGVIFIRYTDRTRPTVQVINEQLRVTVQEPVLKQRLILEPDVVALSMAIAPGPDNRRLAEILKVPLSREGFFLEAHLKMRPMDFMEEGIFLCGMAHYPKFIEECISHALATAGRAITILSKEPLYIGGVVAVVDQSKCVGCLTCTRVCPFHIPVIDPHRVGNGGILGAAYIEPAKCQGCGTCTGECPAKAIQLVSYTDEQVMVPEAGLLGRWLPPVEERVLA
ncbi:MAG: 4Fe-4S binding protein [Anaerolineae bacterium]